MLKNKSIFQISTLVCLSSVSICNLLIELLTYINCSLYSTFEVDLGMDKIAIVQEHAQSTPTDNISNYISRAYTLRYKVV
jgi:hypothetical protein